MRPDAPPERTDRPERPAAPDRPDHPDRLYIGLMSGTSLDGVDGVLARFDGPGRCALLAHHHLPFGHDLKRRLLALNSAGADELHTAALSANALALAYAEVVQALLAASGTPADAVRAVGAHGQTVRHCPGPADGSGYTLQLLNGSLLAERCGIDVVCDFRSRDIAAGGQGAPLVPAFHHALFARPGEDSAVVNIGGIANITLLPASGAVAGHDCGPGNVLMDLWVHQHLGQAFDADGAWAAGGQADAQLLQQLLADPYFARTPPKSTGRDDFHADWLQRQLQAHIAQAGGSQLAPQDVQATLAELTALAIARDLQASLPQARVLQVCGGGALNRHLMARLQARLPGVAVQRIDTASGMHPMHVEAAAFAWLARAHVRREPGNLPAVTGARGLRVLGALHPAG